MLRLNIQLFADEKTAEEIEAENEAKRKAIAEAESKALDAKLAKIQANENQTEEVVESSKGDGINTQKKLEDEALKILEEE